MKIKEAFLFWFAIMSFSINAQSYNIINGDTFRLKSSLDYIHSIGQDSTGFYIYEGIRDNKTIYKFSLDKAKLIYKIDLKEKANFRTLNSTDYLFTKIHIANGEILCFAELEDNRDIKTLAVIAFDAATGAQSGKPQVLDKLSNEGHKGYYGAGYEWTEGFVRFDISFTPDKTKLLVVSERKKNDTEQEVRAQLFAINGLQKLWEKQLLKTHEKSTISSHDYVVNNDGALFYLFDFLRKIDDVIQGIGMIGPKDYQNKTYTIPSKGITTKETLLKLVDNKILCYGRFLNGENTNYFMDIEKCGFFFICIDIASFKPEGEKFDYYNSKSLYLESIEDVSLVVMNKNYYLIKKYNWRGIADGDLIICKYSRNNTLEWIKEIKRSCEAPISEKGDLVKGINFIEAGNSIQFLYFDHKKNIAKFPNINEINPDSYSTLKSLGNGVLVCNTIDENGTINRKIFQPTQDLYLDRLVEENFRIKQSKSIIVRNFIKKNDISYSIFRIIN
jgi:hypothetical protein